MKWQTFVPEGPIDKKCPDYVYVKWEYWSTMQKIKHYLRYENKVNKSKVLSYCEALRCMWNNKNHDRIGLHIMACLAQQNKA